MHYFITGDTHGNFSRIKDFCKKQETTKEDVIIILGDAGINFFLDERDRELKDELSEYPITFFCIHGNHEARPYETGGYEEIKWHGGMVYVEEANPNLLFAKDGEIYDFKGRSVIVIGGAYSVDKDYRLSHGMRWFDTEQPDEETKRYVEEQLDRVDWSIDYVLSHTVPVEAEPVWNFIPGLDQETVDKSTEKWLQEIYDHLDLRIGWFAGHYHCESEEEDIRIMFEDYDEICCEE